MRIDAKNAQILRTIRQASRNVEIVVAYGEMSTLSEPSTGKVAAKIYLLPKLVGKLSAFVPPGPMSVNFVIAVPCIDDCADRLFVTAVPIAVLVVASMPDGCAPRFRAPVYAAVLLDLLESFMPVLISL